MVLKCYLLFCLLYIGCSNYTSNYDCVALADVMSCPAGLKCQPFSDLATSACIPCECNLVFDDATCSNGCIGNVCGKVTTVIPSSSVTSKCACVCACVRVSVRAQPNGYGIGLEIKRFQA